MSFEYCSGFDAGRRFCEQQAEGRLDKARAIIRDLLAHESGDRAKFVEAIHRAEAFLGAVA
jgi:hypothetical protein